MESLDQSSLSPLAQRLCDALAHIGGTNSQLNVIVGAFSKRLRKHPPADDEILAGLIWIERMAQAVRGEVEISELPSADDNEDMNNVSSESFPEVPETDSLIPANW